jgi:hypothetical protein
VAARSWPFEIKGQRESEQAQAVAETVDVHQLLVGQKKARRQ